MRVEELVLAYCEQFRADGRSENTIAQCRRHGMLAARFFGDVDVTTIDHGGIARFLTSAMAMRTPDGGAKKATSMNALRSSMRTMWAFAAAAGLVTVNPARLVRRARTAPPPPRGLSDFDRAKLVAELDEAETWAERRDAALFHTLLGAGLRIGSAVAARVDDLDLEAGELRLCTMKNDAADVVFVSPTLVEILRPWVADLQRGMPLFPASDGRALSPRQAHRRLALLTRRAGITRSVSPHSLRHSFAQRVYGRTGDLLVTARALCHRSTASTQVYARADTARVREAIAR